MVITLTGLPGDGQTKKLDQRQRSGRLQADILDGRWNTRSTRALGCEYHWTRLYHWSAAVCERWSTSRIARQEQGETARRELDEQLQVQGWRSCKESESPRLTAIHTDRVTEAEPLLFADHVRECEWIRSTHGLVLLGCRCLERPITHSIIHLRARLVRDQPRVHAETEFPIPARLRHRSRRIVAVQVSRLKTIKKGRSLNNNSA